MQNEAVFRAILIVGVVMIVGTSGYYRHKAGYMKEKISRRAEGPLTMIGLRLSGLIWLASVLTWVIRPQAMVWSQVSLPVWVRLSGAALLAISGPLAAWVLRSLGSNITDTVETRREHTLVTHGPYRWVRHPLYAVGTLFAIGAALVAANWFMAVVWTFGIVLLMRRTDTEEAKLVERFGDDYREYMACTGRFFPRLAG